MSNQDDLLQKLETRKANLLKVLEHEEETLNSIYTTLFERISRLQIEESILMAYLESSRGNQAPFDAYALSSLGYDGHYGENKFEVLKISTTRRLTGITTLRMIRTHRERIWLVTKHPMQRPWTKLTKSIPMTKPQMKKLLTLC